MKLEHDFPPPFFSRLVTVQCTRDGQFVMVLAREATLPHLDTHSVSLLESDDPSCSPVDDTPTFVIFQFPVTACGTTVKVSQVVARYFSDSCFNCFFFCCDEFCDSMTGCDN